MLTIDLKVPSIGRKYQFNLDSNVKVGVLIAEMTEVICRKEQCALIGSEQQLELYSEDHRAILEKERTLTEQDVHNADCLLLL